LQEAITKWNAADADMVVARAILRLELQRYRSTDALQPIIDAYIMALSSYVRGERDMARKGTAMRNPAAQLASLRHDVCRKLDDLDAKRDEIRSTMLLSKNQKVPEPVKIANSNRR